MTFTPEQIYWLGFLTPIAMYLVYKGVWLLVDLYDLREEIRAEHKKRKIECREYK